MFQQTKNEEAKAKQMESKAKPPLQKSYERTPMQQKVFSDLSQMTGMDKETQIPIQMKARYEALSGVSFKDVRVHYNSERPARLEAYAYTQGTQVYMGPGQERYLPHELGHVIQQKQGMVRPIRPIAGVWVNDDPSLERQADHMPARSAAIGAKEGGGVVQRMPWHAHKDFPHSKLNAKGVTPTTPMTGYRFLGYTYPSRKVISGADQTAAITAAAEFIANLPIPPSTGFLTKDQIKKYKNAATGDTTFAEDSAAFTAVGAALAGLPAAATDAAKKTAAATAVPSYGTSELIPDTVLDGHVNKDVGLVYTFFQDLWEAYEANEGAGLPAIILALQGVPGYTQRLGAGKRAQIAAAADLPALAGILQTISSSTLDQPSKDYKKHEKGQRRTQGFPAAMANTVAESIDPFHITVRTSFPAGAPTTNLNLHYQFSRESYSYLVRLDKNANTFRMANRVAEAAVGANYYASAHNITEAGVIKDLASRAVTPGATLADRAENSVTFDAITKLAGEGARWQCVRAHAAHLKNSSRFYTTDATYYYYITFENLWKSWTKFNNAFNIEDPAVIDKLVHNLLDNIVKEPVAARRVSADDYELQP